MLTNGTIKNSYSLCIFKTTNIQMHQSVCMSYFLCIFIHVHMHIQGVSKRFLQNFRGDKAHHKDSELHRNPCPQ